MREQVKKDATEKEKENSKKLKRKSCGENKDKLRSLVVGRLMAMQTPTQEEEGDITVEERIEKNV
jgi:hypothetical protein